MTDVIHQKIVVELFIKPNVLKVETDQALVDQTISAELPQVLAYLNNELSKTSGQFLVGNEFSVADIGVATHLRSLDLVNVKFDESKYPFLAAYKKFIFSSTVFKSL